MKIERTIGIGKECVYAYYFPSQVREGSFPHKIGKTKRSAIKRIITQQASMQEEPVIGTLIFCDNCFEVEAKLHLFLEDRKLSTFGDEWFDIHPNAIVNCFNTPLPELKWYQQLKYLRLTSNMTQTELANAADLRQATISSIENGNSCHMDTILEICRELKVHMTFVPIEE